MNQWCGLQNRLFGNSTINWMKPSACYDLLSSCAKAPFAPRDSSSDTAWAVQCSKSPHPNLQPRRRCKMAKPAIILVVSAIVFSTLGGVAVCQPDFYAGKTILMVI